MWLKDNLNREAQINGFWKNKKIVTQLYGAALQASSELFRSKLEAGKN